MRYLVLIFVFLPLFSSCKDENDGFSTLVIHRDDGSKIESKWHKDSAHVVSVIESYSSGELHYDYTEINDLKEGLVLGYFKSGNLKYKGHLRSDTVDGKVELFYDNDQNSVKGSFNYEDDILVGNQQKYYENGVVEEYYTSIYGKNTGLSIHRNPNGDITNLNGKFKTLGLLNKDHYNNNDTLKYEIRFAQPEDFEIIYSYSIELSNSPKVWYTVPISNDRLEIKKLLEESGKYKLSERLDIKNVVIDTIGYENHETILIVH